MCNRVTAECGTAPVIRYDSSRYATVISDADGRYRFKTIKSGAYPVGGDWVRPPHVHFDVRGQVNRLV